jgi:hypothetical protein
VVAELPTVFACGTSVTPGNRQAQLHCGVCREASGTLWADRDLAARFYRLFSFSICFLFTSLFIYLLKKEQKLRVFENGVLWRMFRPEREEETGSRRKLQNEEIHNL